MLGVVFTDERSEGQRKISNAISAHTNYTRFTQLDFFFKVDIPLLYNIENVTCFCTIK